MAAVRKSVSVAMAAYNGEKYIGQQIGSILKQLKEEDEIVISLDPSTDRTREVVLSFRDPRIRLIDGPGQGVVKNFENAIRHTNNDVIFLSDQDDVWKPDKVDRVLQALEGNDLVLHDCVVTNNDLDVIEPSMFELRKPSLSIGKNIIKNTMMGCCMAFDCRLKKEILPFPEPLPMHDQWIGLAALKTGKVKLLEQPLLLYRRHGGNESSMHHASWKQMLAWRIQIIKAVMKRRPV